MRFAGQAAVANQPGTADRAARDATLPRGGSPEPPWSRCDEPEDDAHFACAPANAQEAKIRFSRRRSGPRRSWVTPHAKERVSQRSALLATSVREMLDSGRRVSLGEVPRNRRSDLIYSKVDDRCFVVVQDIDNWAVVTVLPLWMWGNDELSESSPQADEARRMAFEPRSRQPKRENVRYQSRRPTGLFRRRR